MNPPDEYGWLTARSPEEIKALGLRQTGDEYWLDNRWLPIANQSSGALYHPNLFPIRRPVNPNSDQPPGQEPWEMLALGNLMVDGDEFTTDGKHWTLCRELVGSIIEDDGLLAVRRRKRVVEPACYVCGRPTVGRVALCQALRTLDAENKELREERDELVFLIRNALRCWKNDNGTWVVTSQYVNTPVLGSGASMREAIDAAMKGGGE